MVNIAIHPSQFEVVDDTIVFLDTSKFYRKDPRKVSIMIGGGGYARTSNADIDGGTTLIEATVFGTQIDDAIFYTFVNNVRQSAAYLPQLLDLIARQLVEVKKDGVALSPADVINFTV